MHISDDGRAGQKTILYTSFGSCANMTWRHARHMASSACIPLPDIHHPYLFHFCRRRASESRPQGYKPSLPGRPATAKARHSSSHVALADHMIPSSLVPCSGLAVTDVIVDRNSQLFGLWRLMIDNSYQLLRCGIRLVEGLVIVVRFLMPIRRSRYQPLRSSRSISISFSSLLYYISKPLYHSRSSIEVLSKERHQSTLHYKQTPLISIPINTPPPCVSPSRNDTSH